MLERLDEARVSRNGNVDAAIVQSRHGLVKRGGGAIGVRAASPQSSTLKSPIFRRRQLDHELIVLQGLTRTTPAE